MHSSRTPSDHKANDEEDAAKTQEKQRVPANGLRLRKKHEANFLVGL